MGLSPEMLSAGILFVLFFGPVSYLFRQLNLDSLALCSIPNIVSSLIWSDMFNKECG